MELDDLSFRLILDEVGKIFTFYRDGLAFYGTYCCIKKALNYTTSLARFIRLHWYSKRSPVSIRAFGRWAVITGCTEGIGKAFAQELAHLGMNIYMFNKPVNGDLERVAQDIRDQFHVEVETYTVDFSRTSIYPDIEDKLADKEIGILVNNVGVSYSYPMMFLDVPDEKLWHLINVNIAAATMMTSIVLPSMVKRRRGAIINMSGVSSQRPTPYMAVYAATKSYVDNFSRALNHEYRSKGIIIQSLAPFYVATRMTSFSPTLSSHSTLIPSASDYVKSALSTLGYADRTTGYWPHTVVSWVINKMSDSVWLWFATRLNLALRRQAQQRHRHRSGDSRRRHQSDRQRHQSRETSRRSESMTSLSDASTSRRSSYGDGAAQLKKSESAVSNLAKDNSSESSPVRKPRP